MMKRLFAVATVTLAGLAGLAGSSALSGCSSTRGPAVAAEAGAEKADAAITVADAVPSETCPSTAPIDATQLPWKPPATLFGACTAGDLEAFVAYVDATPAASYADWKAAVTSAACAGCIFGKQTDDAWKPLVEDDNEQLVGLYVGGCIALSSGSETCGHAYQSWFDCRFDACTDCANGDQTALPTCLSAASKGACKTAFDSVTTLCGDGAIRAAEAACVSSRFVFEGPIRAQCIGHEEGGE